MCWLVFGSYEFLTYQMGAGWERLRIVSKAAFRLSVLTSLQGNFSRSSPTAGLLLFVPFLRDGREAATARNARRLQRLPCSLYTGAAVPLAPVSGLVSTFLAQCQAGADKRLSAPPPPRAQSSATKGEGASFEAPPIRAGKGAPSQDDLISRIGDSRFSAFPGGGGAPRSEDACGPRWQRRH